MKPHDDPKSFILENTILQPTSLVPEISLYVAEEVVPIWHLTEEQLEEQGLPPPFWAFAWAGGQALSRYILDNPELVRGKSVLDFATGSGLCAIAAMKAGASRVQANDIDELACTASLLNAHANEVELSVIQEDIVGKPNQGWDVVLAGDICYEQPLAGRVEAWLKSLAHEGASVFIGDPGRTYLPKQGLDKLVSYAVMTTRELEDNDVRNTTVWQVKLDP